jgi:hypothetical protein
MAKLLIKRRFSDERSMKQVSVNRMEDPWTSEMRGSLLTSFSKHRRNEILDLTETAITWEYYDKKSDILV